MTTPIEALELKPCPFCGGQAIKDTSGEFRHHGINYPVHRIRCDKSDCLAMPSVKNPIEGACIDTWNTRATASLEGDAVERVARIIAGPLCDATNGEHSITAQGDYRFCTQCGETISKRTIGIVDARNKARAILATGLVPNEAELRADEREKCAPAVSRFEERVNKYVTQLNATGQADLAHLLRRDSDALLAAIRSGDVA